MKYATCLGALLIMSISLFGQSTDYINNGDFESGPTPYCYAEAENASFWKDRMVRDGNRYMHSPDLFDYNVTFTASVCLDGQVGGFTKLTIPGHSGNRYMGMAAYELLQQQYNNTLVPGQHYTISMEIVLSNEFPSNWSGGNSRLNVYLAKSEVKYQSENDANKYCTSDYVNHTSGVFQDIHKVASFEPSIQDYPTAEGWKRVSGSFRAWDNIDDYDWFVIELEIIDYDPPVGASNNCAGDYIFIDDVSMKNAEFCDSPCAPSLGAISYWRYVDNQVVYNDPPTGVIVGGSAGQSFYFYAQNAIGIDFTVFNGWGGESIYNQYAFDPNGLKDVGYDDYWFTWNGEDHNGNFLYPGNDVFVYNLKLWNCGPGNMINYIGEELLYVPSNLNNVAGYDIVNYSLDNCCEDHAYYQNTTFNGYFRKDVVDHITAGNNVTSGPQGPVVVTSSGNVLFHAGEAVNLEPGFTVANGGEFSAVISDCIYGDVKNSLEDRRIVLESGFVHDEENPADYIVKLWPNPTIDGAVHVWVEPQEHNKHEPINLAIMSTVGGLVSELETYSRVEAILHIPSSGVYFIHVFDSNGMRKVALSVVRL